MTKLLRILKRYQNLQSFFLNEAQITLQHINTHIQENKVEQDTLDKEMEDNIDFSNKNPTQPWPLPYIKGILTNKDIVEEKKHILHAKQTIQLQTLQKAYQKHEIAKIIYKQEEGIVQKNVDQEEQKFLDDLRRGSGVDRVD